MTLVIFNTAAALQKHVVDQSILQPSIVSIIEVDGQWYLFHF